MRTYTRKNVRREYIEPIESVLGLCRLCMQHAKESIPIFVNDSDICTSLATRIMMCVGFEITREECLPDIICMECHKQLNNFYEFRKKCTATYHKLKSHMLAVKAKQVNDALSKQILHTNSNLTIDTENSNSSSKDQLLLTINGDPRLHTDTGINGCHIGETKSNTSTSTTDFKCVEEGINKSQQSNPIASNSEDCSDMSDFLSSILIEMGILTKQSDEVSLLESCRTIEVETGDFHRVTLELMEVGEEQKEPVIEQKEPLTNENVESKTLNILKFHPDRPRCDECGKRFATRGVLRRHARTHSGERPYRCAHCGRNFAQRSVLRRHEFVHQEIRPFKCESCPKSFTQRGALAAHARAHEAPNARALALHRCTKCPKVFLHASGLSRHIMTHSGRTFVCSRCQRRFTDKSSLLRHARAKHNCQPAEEPT